MRARPARPRSVTAFCGCALAELAGLVSHAALATPVASPRARAAPWPASPVCLEVQCGHGQDFQPWLQSDAYLALVPRRASHVIRMNRCWIPRANRNASPSASTRHTNASTRSGGPSGGTSSSRTVVPVFNLALVLTFAPWVLISRECDKYRLAPVSTMTPHDTLVRGSCRR